MNIMNKVTLRHMLKNKRRTLVTIVGVIISAAMITAVATLSVSFLEMLIRHTISETGEWHVQYHQVDKEQIEAIENHENTDYIVLVKDRGYARIPGAEDETDKPYLFFRDYNEGGLREFPIELKEGRLPERKNEVAVSLELINDYGEDYAIGKSIHVEIGERYLHGEERSLWQRDPFYTNENGSMEALKIKEEAEFTIVGVIERPTWEYSWSPGYTVVGYIDDSRLNAGETADAAVKVKKLNRSLYDQAEEMAEKNGIENYSFNTELLRYYGVTSNDNLRNTFYSLAGILIAVIIVGSVALIYNAFAISVSERSRYLGMLSSVGATKKQKLNSVLFEGALIGVISVPLGILAGIGGIAVTFQFINSFLVDLLGVTGKFSLVVTPGSIMAAAVISLLTIFISAYIPARRASKIAPMEAIRQTRDVKLTSKAVKTSRLVRNLFGIEADIGLKNLKRNKRRYMATVFSLVISIVLFLSVSYFTDNLKKGWEMSMDETNYDIRVSANDGEKLLPLTKLDSIADWTIVHELSMSTFIEKEDASDSLRNGELDLATEDGKYHYNLLLLALDDKSFNEYAKKVGADPAQWRDPAYAGAIVIDEVVMTDYSSGSGRRVETKVIHKEAGDVLELYMWDYDTEELQPAGSVEIAALTNILPKGGYHMGGDNSLTIVVHENTFARMMERHAGLQPRPYLYADTDDPATAEKELKELKSAGMYIYNYHHERKQMEQFILLMSIFTYGFIILISLIAIANIFNTISTSIALRKREFAMLRSVGMTPRGFNKMIYYESAFYGMKALLYGLPASFAIMLLIFRSMRESFEYGFTVPWGHITIAVVAIFVIVGASMIYSSRKMKNENIIDALKQENI